MATIDLAPLELTDLDHRLDAELAGGKAATLARLRRAGFPVPRGLVVAADQAARLASGEVAATDALDQLRPALAELGRGPWAVRSSAVAEDLDDASFAGQYTTVLSVPDGPAIIDAIRAVAASGGTDRALAYGADPRQPVGVLVMPMVDAVAAGVAFSRDPVTGDDHALVSAVRGLGDRLVDGTSDPDEWEVTPDGATTPRRKVEGAITAERAAEVAALARRVADFEGRPIDVEWAVDADGHLVLLQARPITALPVAPDVDLAPGVWQKDRVHYPSQMTPFGASVFLPSLERTLGTMLHTWGMVLDRIEQVCIGGEVYGRVVPVGPEPTAKRPAPPPPPAPVMGLLARVVPRLRQRMRTARQRLAAGDLERTAARWQDEYLPAVRANVGRLLAVDPDALDPGGLLDHLDETIAFMDRGGEIHFDLFVPYVVAMAEFVQACTQRLGMTDLEAVEVLRGRSSTSSQPAVELATLSARVNEDPAALAVLRDVGPDWLDRLGQAAPDLAADVASWIRSYGWRTNNYDPGAPALAEQPLVLASLLRSAAAGSGGTSSTAEDDAGMSLLRARMAAATPQDRSEVEPLLDRALATYGLREENSLWCDGLPGGLVRRALAAAGRTLAGAGVLHDAGDVAWLEGDEVRAALTSLATGREPDVAALRAAIRARRASWAWVAAHPGAEHLGGEPGELPDLRMLPASGRRINQAFLFFFEQEYGTRVTTAAADLVGLGASAGVRRGRVRVVRSEADVHQLQPGEVLVCPITTPAWSPLFAVAGALVTDHGGVLSHASIVARENGLPAVVGTGSATSTLVDGQEVTVDGTAGTVTIH